MTAVCHREAFRAVGLISQNIYYSVLKTIKKQHHLHGFGPQEKVLNFYLDPVLMVC